MRRKWEILCAILVICVICFCDIRKKPEIVSCITTNDIAYISVLWNGNGLVDKETAAKRVIEMCENNEFQEIKISKYSGEKEASFYITIYRDIRRMEKGRAWIEVKYNPKENFVKIL